MTFYNVLSALLFVGACQAFLQALADSPITLYMAATLAFVIICDAMLTSELVEREPEPVDYSLSMMLLDLLIFTILAYALLMLTPKKNIFEVSVKLGGSIKPWLFWLLLSFYWVVAILWGYPGRIFDRKKWRAFSLWWLCLMPIPFFVSAVYYRNDSFDSVPPYSGIFPLAITVAYLLSGIWAKKPKPKTAGDGF